jgi:hypothetical protein
MIWFYHSGMQALICAIPLQGTKPIAFLTKGLRAAGWRADDLELRKALPRADQPVIERFTEGQQKALELTMRHGDPMKKKR